MLFAGGRESSCLSSANWKCFWQIKRSTYNYLRKRYKVLNFGKMSRGQKKITGKLVINSKMMIVFISDGAGKNHQAGIQSPIKQMHNWPGWGELCLEMVLNLNPDLILFQVIRCLNFEPKATVEGKIAAEAKVSILNINKFKSKI